MSDRPSANAEFKACCADFYADDMVRVILGDSFHPGGETLTRQLLDSVAAGPHDCLLDVAAGQGTSSVLAAMEYGCQVTALDLSPANLERAEARAADHYVSDRLSTRVSDAERLPFEDHRFDVILCECAFCTFPDKQRAAAEMARVLAPGGRLALSDMALDRESFPEDLDTLLLRVACIADAVPAEEMRAMFAEVGFVELTLGDAAWGLEQMVEQIRLRLLSLDLAGKLGKIDLGGLDLTEGKRLAVRSLEIIRQGVAGYVTLTGALPAGGE